jgi:hypothetical protein
MVWCGVGVGFVAVGEELCAVGIDLGLCGVGVVAEAHGFAGLAGLLLSGGKVGGEGGVVGVLDCGGGGGVALELGGEVGELGFEAR